MTNKGTQNSEKIVLSENNRMITDNKEICEKFNNFVVNLAKDIGEENGPLTPEDHPSIQAIKANISSAESQIFILRLWMRPRSPDIWVELAWVRRPDSTLFLQKSYT